jgi:hypothetical protein
MQPGDDAEETAPNEKRPVTAASSVQNLQTNVPYRFDRKKYPHGGAQGAAQRHLAESPEPTLQTPKHQRRGHGKGLVPNCASRSEEISQTSLVGERVGPNVRPRGGAALHLRYDAHPGERETQIGGKELAQIVGTASRPPPRINYSFHLLRDQARQIVRLSTCRNRGVGCTPRARHYERDAPRRTLFTGPTKDYDVDGLNLDAVGSPAPQESAPGCFSAFVRGVNTTESGA